MVDFLFVIIELFAISYDRDVISGNLSKSAFLRKEMDHFERKFQTEGASPTNHCWYPKTRMTVVSCSIKIPAVYCLVLSQSMRVSDRQTDRQRDGQTDGQTDFHDCQDRARIAALRGKNRGDELWRASL